MLDTLLVAIALHIVPVKSSEDRAQGPQGVAFRPQVAMATVREGNLLLPSGEAIQTRPMIRERKPELPIGE